MRELLIGDLHFGIKNNSVTWLESQIEFFEKQIFDIVKKENLDRIIFLGDVTDVRYGINQQVGIEVKNIIRKLAKLFNKDIYFVCGNHDYYSPLEEFIMYNSYELLFGEEFLEKYPHVHFVTREPFLSNDGSLFLPFYWTENTDHFDELLYTYKFGYEVKAIYCHADLTCWPGARITALKGCPIYSGHIHYIVDDPLGNLHNVGAALSLTFNDVNQDRFVYIVEDYKIVKQIKNITTPQFKQLYNDKIFEATHETFDNSYIRLCISSSNINKAKYIDQIKYLKSTYLDSNIRINVIDDLDNGEMLSVEGFNTNIQNYIEDNIPNHLISKYEYIKEKMIEDK